MVNNAFLGHTCAPKAFISKIHIAFRKWTPRALRGAHFEIKCVLPISLTRVRKARDSTAAIVSSDGPPASAVSELKTKLVYPINLRLACTLTASRIITASPNRDQNVLKT
jgi:hypothetical protein